MTGAEWAGILVAAGTLVSAFATLVVAIRTGQKVADTHKLVNGQSETLRQVSGQLGHAEGLAEGLAAVHTTPPHSPV